ncbi:MAG: inositol monophosphatase family protein [Spirochaetota bacterium]
MIHTHEQEQRFQSLVKAVYDCSQFAVEAQADVRRTYKHDGSVLTDTDLSINARLSQAVSELYPEASFISEESVSHMQEHSSYTFVLDPIDGTDVYSQGFPGWCTALGILDSDLQPVGGIISAPRWGIATTEGLLLSRAPHGEVMLNGEPFILDKQFHEHDQIVVSSGACKRLQFNAFRGKIRSFGSTILHVATPMLFDHMQAAVLSSCFIWDIAAAHGIIRRFGLDVRYLTGEPLDYSQLIDRRPTSGYLVAGPEQRIRGLQDLLSHSDEIKK